MDLLQTIANDIGFEYHLYLVQDQLFGSKQTDIKDWVKKKDETATNKPIENNNPGVTEFINKYSLNFPNINSFRPKNRTMKNEKQFLDRDKYDHSNNENYDNVFEPHKVKDRWNGIVGDLVTGSADLSFAPLSVTKYA